MSIVTVKNTNGISKVVNVNKALLLSELRKELIKKEIMNIEDYFLINNIKLDIEDESDTSLEDLLEVQSIVEIGIIVKTIKKTTMEEFLQKGIDEKLSYYTSHQLCRGLVFSKAGIERTFHDLFSFKQVPRLAKKITNTEMSSSYSFSEASMNLHLLTNDKQSAALKSEYVDAKVEYEKSKEHDQSNSTIHEYLISKYTIHQAEFNISETDINVNMDFFKAIQEVVNDEDEEDMRKTMKLVQVLNEWGFYIPFTFKMGGLLYTTDSKMITSYEETIKDKENFNTAASAAFSSTSFQLDFSHFDETSSGESEKQQFKNLQVRQIGGKAGCTKANKDFVESLTDINTWEITDITKFYPSLLLIKDVYVDGYKSEVLMDAVRLLNEYYYIPALNKIQPHIDIYQYVTDIEKELNKE